MVEILAGKPNPFNGMVIIPSELPSDPEEFDVRLAVSIENGLQTVT